MKTWIFTALICMGAALAAPAQIPFEVFAGENRTTLDVMFFRNFKNRAGQPSAFLFFNRNRGAVDYSNRTAFGSTNAVSYNFKSGLGLVAVGQVLGAGFFPKAGAQFYVRKKDLTVFTWAVVELMKDPDVDWFLLARFQPKIRGAWRFFSQLELVNGLAPDGSVSLTQRGRIGIGWRDWQLGAGADFSQAGKSDLAKTRNAGAFLRHEF